MSIMYHVLIQDNCTGEHRAIRSDLLPKEMPEEQRWELLCRRIIERNEEWGFVETDLMKDLLNAARKSFLEFDLLETIRVPFKTDKRDLLLLIIGQRDFTTDEYYGPVMARD